MQANISLCCFGICLQTSLQVAPVVYTSSIISIVLARISFFSLNAFFRFCSRSLCDRPCCGLVANSRCIFHSNIGAGLIAFRCRAISIAWLNPRCFKRVLCSGIGSMASNSIWRSFNSVPSSNPNMRANSKRLWCLSWLIQLLIGRRCCHRLMHSCHGGALIMHRPQMSTHDLGKMLAQRRQTLFCQGRVG